MARPLRAHWRIRTTVRRRHRTWMRAMVLATLAWGAWWVTVILYKLAPGIAPPVGLTYWVAGIAASAGAVLGFLTIRARLIWVLLAGVPLFANLSVLAIPLVLDAEVRAFLEIEKSASHDRTLDDPPGDRPTGTGTGAGN